MEYLIYKKEHQSIAGVMKHTLVFFIICTRQPVADNQVCPLFNKTTHLPGMFSRICIIPINQQIAVSINIAQHPSYHITLSLSALMTHNGTNTACLFNSIVSRIIVIYIHITIWQSRTEVFDNFSNRPSFVITWYKHSYFHNR